MTKQHLARLIAPRAWHLERKEQHWTARPRPGPHKLAASLTLNLLLRSMLHMAKTSKEIKYILNKGLVLVNHHPRTDYKFPIGFMDVIQIPTLNEHYRILYDRLGKFTLHKIPVEETQLKILKIIGKTKQKKGKTQINLHDGSNFISDTHDGKSGDSIIYDITTNTTMSTLKLEPGNLLYCTGGRYVGRTGKLLDVIRKHDLEEPKVRFTIDGKTHETLLRHCLIIGKEKPAITLQP